MNTEEKYESIERYLDQKMTEEERNDFEQLLENDAVLKEELELHQQMTETLKGEKVHQLRAILKKTDSNWESNEAVPKGKIQPFNFRRVIAIAATVLLVVFAYQFFFSGDETISNEQLFADNFQPYQMILNQRDISTEEKNVLLENAISAYTKGDFQTASIAFRQLAQNDPANISYEFYYAVAELGAENSDSAIGLFKDILVGSDHPFNEQSQWYLALAYLQKGDKKNAVNLLKEIQSGQFKHAEAQQILKALN